MKMRHHNIKGHLDISVNNNEDEFNGEVTRWQEVMIHGNPDGLRSFAHLLLELAGIDQEQLEELPVGAREHYHLFSNNDISKSSVDVVIGRLDAKGNASFYDEYIAKDRD